MSDYDAYVPAEQIRCLDRFKKLGQLFTFYFGVFALSIYMFCFTTSKFTSVKLHTKAGCKSAENLTIRPSSKEIKLRSSNPQTTDDVTTSVDHQRTKLQKEDKNTDRKSNRTKKIPQKLAQSHQSGIVQLSAFLDNSIQERQSYD